MYADNIEVVEEEKVDLTSIKRWSNGTAATETFNSLWYINAKLKRELLWSGSIYLIARREKTKVDQIINLSS